MLACVTAFTLIACTKNDGDNNQDELTQFLKVYAQYVANTQENGVEPLSYEDLLKDIKALLEKSIK